MARYDELRVGDRVTVTDLRYGTHHDGTVIELRPDPTGSSAGSKVVVKYDGGAAAVLVAPGFVTLIGEETP